MVHGYRQRYRFGRGCFHNASLLAAQDRGPYFYLPKLESMEEAALWQCVLEAIESQLGLAPGQMKVTVLIETLPAAFEMDEILHALRSRIVALNCGRWDYIFSYLKTFRLHRDRVLPERAQLTMGQGFLKAYSELLVHTCPARRAGHGRCPRRSHRRLCQSNEGRDERVRADNCAGAAATRHLCHTRRDPGPEISPVHASGDQLLVERASVAVSARRAHPPVIGTSTRQFDNSGKCACATWRRGSRSRVHPLAVKIRTPNKSRATRHG